jgi:cytochrome c-type biogenesis protein CcmH
MELMSMIVRFQFDRRHLPVRSIDGLRAWQTISSLLIFTALVILASSMAYAQEGEPLPVTDDQVNAVARDLFCPVCENVPLDVCPTQACAEWRELIRLKLSEGWDAEQIRTYFAQQYGDRVLSAPPARGLNWLVYILPPLAILAGVFLLFKAFQSWKAAAPADETGSPDATREPGDVDLYFARLEEELKKK